MQIECPNCRQKVAMSPDTFLNQKHVKCATCLLTIDLRNPDGTLKHLKFTFDEEKIRKQSHD